MKPTTLAELLESNEIRTKDGGLIASVNSSWIVEGEDRLSYTTIVRLVECCREHHWNTDIYPVISKFNLDSITKSISCEFYKPILVGSSISINYKIKNVRTRGYEIEFHLVNNVNNDLHSLCSMVSVFYSAFEHSVIAAPSPILDKLNSLKELV